MVKIAVYGKGGIGKSTTVSNMSACLADKGLKVLQIGCDPKADSTLSLHGGVRLPSVLDLIREKDDDFTLDDMIIKGYKGVLCAEAGGPVPGVGCAGRGVITALEKLQDKGVYEKYHPDVVFYDVLGDVVCGGFSMPMRKGYADKIYIVTSGENMSIYAAANIAAASRNFASRGYAPLGGFILNRRNVKNEDEKVKELCADFDSNIIGAIDRSQLILTAEEKGKTAVELFPDSDIADEYRILAENILLDLKK